MVVHDSFVCTEITTHGIDTIMHFHFPICSMMFLILSLEFVKLYGEYNINAQPLQ